MKYTIAQLTHIRRKVDKATKRADAYVGERKVLGFDEATGLPIFKTAYCPIYPASVGKTVEHNELPIPLCVDADEARTIAKFWTPQRLHSATYC